MGKKVRCTFFSGQRKLCKCEKGRTGSNYGGLGTIHGGVRTLLVFAIRLAPILGISKTVLFFFIFYIIVCGFFKGSDGLKYLRNGIL